MSTATKKSKKSSSVKTKFDYLDDADKQKGLSLFDHIKHIQKVQDPDYFKNLKDVDKKSFNHFMILRGLSMNPELLETISTLYGYFDIIPSPQFYTLLIGLIPLESPRTFHPWIKGKKKPYTEELVKLVAKRYEVSETEAYDYIKIYMGTDSGIEELYDICRGYGLTDKEVEKLMIVE